MRRGTKVRQSGKEKVDYKNLTYKTPPSKVSGGSTCARLCPQGYEGIPVDKYALLVDFMNHTPDVIYFKDKRGRLVMVNQAHANGLGLKPQEVAGKTDFDFFPKNKAQKMFKDDMYVMRTGKPIIDKVERATRPDGVDNYVSTTKVPSYDDKGEITGLVGITRDITHRMQLVRLREEKDHVEKELRALQELNKSKSDFVSVVSHELRTPLTIIKEAIMLILDEIAGSLNNNQKELLIKAKDNVERLKNIIEELFDMSRIERGRLKLHYSLVNLNDLLKDLLGFFKRLAESKGINLEYHLPKTEVNLFLDTERINQVISNLINNAVKFTEAGGKIEVEIKVLEDKVRIGVTDTGIGIAKVDLSKVFNKFVQTSNGTAAQRKGLGLGLSIAKELVQRHGGEIWVESKMGIGSKFYFTLPRLFAMNVLGKDVRERINNLLDKVVSTYLINLLIINFKEFKRRIKVGPKKMLGDLKLIINLTFNEFSFSVKDKPQIVIEDYRRGEFSIIFPNAGGKKVAEVCELLKSKIKRYLIEKSGENVFMNLGIFSYPSKTPVSTTQQLLTNFYIKKIYIGSEMRRFRRVGYSMSIEMIFPQNKKESSHTIDISCGGVCFMSKVQLKTDAQVEIKLELSKRKKLICVKGRVAWVKNIEQFSVGNIGKYKIGLEFIDLKDEDRKTLSKFIKSISAPKS